MWGKIFRKGNRKQEDAEEGQDLGEQEDSVLAVPVPSIPQHLPPSEAHQLLGKVCKSF
jgi:hypothetical protein